MEKSAGLVLFREKNGKREYLLLRYTPDYWGLSKGRIEKNEEEKAAAIREAEEETGLKEVKLIPGFEKKINYFFKNEGKATYKEVIWFLGKVFDYYEGKVSWEHQELKWLNYEEAVKLITHKKDREVLEKAEQFLKLV